MQSVHSIRPPKVKLTDRLLNGHPFRGKVVRSASAAAAAAAAVAFDASRSGYRMTTFLTCSPGVTTWCRRPSVNGSVSVTVSRCTAAVESVCAFAYHSELVPTAPNCITALNRDAIACQSQRVKSIEEKKLDVFITKSLRKDRVSITNSRNHVKQSKGDIN